VYSALFRFWPVEDSEELVDGPTGCVEVARGGCLFAWNFSATRPPALTEAEKRHNTKHDAALLNSLLAYRLKIPQAKNRAMHYNRDLQRFLRQMSAIVRRPTTSTLKQFCISDKVTTRRV
jgi:hypothetical protein